MFSFVFMTRFSVEGSLPRIASLEPGSEQGPPEGWQVCVLPVFSLPTPFTPNLPRKEEGTETLRAADVHV